MKSRRIIKSNTKKKKKAEYKKQLRALRKKFYDPLNPFRYQDEKTKLRKQFGYYI